MGKIVASAILNSVIYDSQPKECDEQKAMAALPSPA
jgi:hypothetical protein